MRDWTSACLFVRVLVAASINRFRDQRWSTAGFSSLCPSFFQGYDALQIFSSAEQDTPRSAPLRSALSTTRAPTTSDDVVLLSPRKGLGFGEEDDDWFSEDGELLPKMADPYSPLPDTDPSVRKRLPFASRDPFKDYCGFPSSRTSSDSSTPTLRPGISWESGAGEIASILERQKRAGRIQRLSSSPSASEDPPCLALEEEKKENEVEALANRLLHVAKAVTDQVEMSVAVRTAQARPAGHRGDGGSARRLRARTPADQRTEREVAVDEEGEEAVARFGWFILNELREVRHADPALTRAYVHLGKVLEELRELRLASRAQKAPKVATECLVLLGLVDAFPSMGACVPLAVRIGDDKFRCGAHRRLRTADTRSVLGGVGFGGSRRM